MIDNNEWFVSWFDSKYYHILYVVGLGTFTSYLATLYLRQPKYGIHFECWTLEKHS